MKLREIYTNCNTVLNKDGNDGYISMDRWNTLLPHVLMELIRKKCEELFTITDSNIRAESIYSSKVIQKLITSQLFDISGINPAIDGSGMWIDLPTNYLYFVSSYGQMIDQDQYSQVTNPFKKVELVTERELNVRQSNMLSPPIAENPVCVIRNDKVYFYPAGGIFNLRDFIFVRKPLTPFLDYYMDANAQTVFMDAGTSKTMTGGLEYRDGTTTGSKTSQTVELEIPDDFHPEFTDMMIEKLSLPFDDQLKLQYSMAKQQQEDKV
jgi:hypothetical protein